MAKKKVKRITSLRGFAEDYPIKWMDTLMRKGGHLAEVDHDDGEIHLDAGYKKNKARTLKCLAHEAFHVVGQNTADPLEEETLQRYATAFMTILIDSGVIDPDEFEFGE